MAIQLWEKTIKVLDLYSGAGGMSKGFELAGFDVVAAVDNWPDALRTLRLNNPEVDTIEADLSDEGTCKKIFGKLKDIDVVIGGPPCQGFSIAGKRDPQDKRNMLYKGFVLAIKMLAPKAFIMENVPTIASSANKDLFRDILSDFENLGYRVSSRVLLASDFGVPQNRKRMFIVGIRKSDSEFAFPKKFDAAVTTEQAIGDLPEESLEDGHKYPTKPSSSFQKWARRGSLGIFNHQITEHSDQTRHVISHVPDGGNHKDLPLSLLGVRNVNIAWTRLNSQKPSFTIDTGHRHHFHYKWNRVPTARESARLQSFPDTYVFVGSKTSQLRQIGNAVPPLLAFEMAKSLWEQIKR